MHRRQRYLQLGELTADILVAYVLLAYTRSVVPHSGYSSPATSVLVRGTEKQTGKDTAHDFIRLQADGVE